VPNILPSANFKDWAKDPKTGMLILMGSLLTVFVYAWLHSKNENDQDCKEQLMVWQQLYMGEKRVNDSFKMEIIMKDQTIEEMPEKVDSLLRAKTTGPVKRILKHRK
jgi:hypothetical protein